MDKVSRRFNCCPARIRWRLLRRFGRLGLGRRRRGLVGGRPCWLLDVFGVEGSDDLDHDFEAPSLTMMEALLVSSSMSHSSFSAKLVRTDWQRVWCLLRLER